MRKRSHRSSEDKRGLFRIQSFRFDKVRALEPELGVYLTVPGFAAQALAKRPVLTNLFHEALGLEREVRAMERFIQSAKIKPLKNESHADYRERVERLTEEEYRTLTYLKSSANQASESLVYALDGLAQSTASSLEVPTDRVIGGKYVADKITLLEAIRAVANWQRHHHQWLQADETIIALRYNPKNWSHRVLKKLGLFRFGSDIPIRFLKMLRFSSYLQLERAFKLAMNYMILEMGIKHGKKAARDRERYREERTALARASRRLRTSRARGSKTR